MVRATLKSRTVASKARSSLKCSNGSKPSISNERQRVATSRTALPTSSIADPRHLEHLIATRSTLLRAIRTRNRDPRPPPEYDYASGSDPRVPIGDAFAFTFVAGLPCSSAPASNLSQSHSYSRCASFPASHLPYMSSPTDAFGAARGNTTARCAGPRRVGLSGRLLLLACAALRAHRQSPGSAERDTKTRTLFSAERWVLFIYIVTKVGGERERGMHRRPCRRCGECRRPAAGV
jgi:hypothetical protein